MALHLTPEVGVTLSAELHDLDLAERARASAVTTALLMEHGLEVDPTDADQQVAVALTTSYAKDDESKKKVSKAVAKAEKTKAAPPLRPASLILVNNILQEFGHRVADEAVQIRHLVTNKLIEETENPDPRVRIRALELLGKVSDVGLFAEKTEVTITHQTTDDIKERLRRKLTKLVNPEEDQDQDQNVIIDGETIDLDAELGLSDEGEWEEEDDAENDAENEVDEVKDEVEPQAPMPENMDKNLAAAAEEALYDDLVQENDPEWGKE